MAQGCSQSGPADGKVPQVFSKKVPGQDGGGDDFGDVSRQYDQALFHAYGSHNIGHAGIAAGPQLGGGAAGTGSGYDLAGDQVAAQIADQQTQYTFGSRIHDSFLPVRYVFGDLSYYTVFLLRCTPSLR